MASVERNGCDGCGGEYTAAELYPVEMPDGETAVCCPECREYAKSAAEKQAELVATGSCDGCGDRVPADDLNEIELPDGATVECCSDCEEEAKDSSDGAGDGTAENRVDPSDRSGHDTEDDRAEEAHEADSTVESEADRVGSDGSRPDDVSDSPGQDESSVNRCDECLDAYSVELFEVVTVDDRTERLCRECKEAALEDGIVSSVRMRRSEAFRILDIDGRLEGERLREAYLERVREVHPDLDRGDRDAFKKVQRAYERLTEE